MTPTNLLLIVLLQLGRVFGNPEGPPSQACITQMPDHPGSPQPDSSTPYNITLNPESYAAGSDITVTVHSTTSATFRGFFVQAHRVGSSVPVGTFILVDTKMNDIHTQLLDCSGSNTAWGHNSNIDKTIQSATWRAPAVSQGDIVFSATFVQTYNIYWRPEAVTTTATYTAGNWNLWSDWGACSLTCGGFRTRSRACSVSSCVGDSVAVDTCSACPTEEPNTIQWNPWSSWNPCSCSSSQRSRTRICNDPGNTGDQCPGNNSDTEDCTPSDCNNNGDTNPIAATPTPTPTKKSTGLSTGQIIGIVFGILAAISLIVSLTWVCCCCFCMGNRGQMGMNAPPPGRRESVPMQPMGLPSMNSRRDGSMIGGNSIARSNSIVGSETGRWLPERTRGFGGLQTRRYY